MKMILSSGTEVIGILVKEHLPQGTSLTMLAEQNKSLSLVEIIVNATGRRTSKGGNDVLIGTFAITTLPPLVADSIKATGLMLPKKQMEWAIDQLEDKGSLRGHIKVGIKANKRSPTGYEWEADFNDGGLEPGKPSESVEDDIRF